VAASPIRHDDDGNDDAQRAIDNPKAVALLDRMWERLQWLHGAAGAVEPAIMREQLNALVQDIVKLDEDRAFNIRMAHYLAQAALEERDVARRLADEAGLRLDEVSRVLESERQRRLNPEDEVADRISFELDISKQKAREIVDILTGDVDVYISAYTKLDIEAVLDEAIEQVEEERRWADDDGGIAD
jgi:hypothetical protein